MNVKTSLTPDEFSDLMKPLKPVAGEVVAVAVSGGGDSLALTLLLGYWCKSHNVSLTALTVDHGLREGSSAEALQVGTWLEKYDIPHVCLPWQGGKPDRNIQDMAREARYGLMGDWCQNNKVSKLFIAHHQGDQAETFLLRLFRGSGVDGLSAMTEQSDYPVTCQGEHKISLCRPLLSVPKERLLQYLDDKGQPWIEDPSNDNESYMRIKVRNLLQDNDIDGFNVDRLTQTALRMSRVKSVLHDLTDTLTQNTVTFAPEGWAEVKVEPLLAAHDEIALRCLASVFKWVAGGKYVPRLSRLESLYKRLAGDDFSGQTLAGCLVSPMTEGRLMISREISAIQEIIPTEQKQAILWDGRFTVITPTEKGQVKKIELPEWQKACHDHPELRKMKLPQVIRCSLLCFVTADEKVILPSFFHGYEDNGLQIEHAIRPPSS